MSKRFRINTTYANVCKFYDNYQHYSEIDCVMRKESGRCCM